MMPPMPAAQRFTRVTRPMLAGLAALVLLGTPTVAAQGNCNVPNGNGNCVIADNATQSANITITRAVRMILSTNGIALNTAAATEFNAGFGQTTGPTLTVRANTGWNVAIRATQTTWTGTGPTARTNKPAGELSWGLGAGGPFTDMTTANVTMQSGAATGGTVLSLFFRVDYAWLLDRPGAYTLPLQLTLTAP